MKRKNPLFTVIIPTYNRAKLLKKAIQSVIDQTISDWELVVVDDGSTDDTKEVIIGFGDERIQYVFQEKKERSVARNIGIKKATGNYICFLDDDDFFLENHLSQFNSFLTKKDFPEIILRSGYSKEFESGKRTETPNYNIQQHKNPVHFSAYNMCGVWSLCIPVGFLEEDVFPVDFPHWQDTHLILRLLSKYPFHQIDAYTYIYRIHSQMGSIHHFSKAEFSKRMELNLEAIKDLFDKYDMSDFLPNDTSSFLLAEKQMEYAIRGINILGRRKSIPLFYKSLANKVSWRFWKMYVIYGISFVYPTYFSR